MRSKLTNEDKEKIMTKAFKQFGIDEHIKKISAKKEAYTFAEKIAVQNRTVTSQNPALVKNSYMYCEMLDICFFFYGDKAAFSYSGLALTDNPDITEHKLYKAFEAAEKVIKYMQGLADVCVSINELKEAAKSL